MGLEILTRGRGERNRKERRQARVEDKAGCGLGRWKMCWESEGVLEEKDNKTMK